MSRPLRRIGTATAEYLRRDRPLRVPQLVALVVAGLLAVTASAFLPERTVVRALLAGVLGVLVAVVCARSPRQGIFVTLGWLAIVGGLRRVVTTFQADPGRDPLLLVGPVAIAILFASALARGTLGRRRWLADGMLALCIVAGLWALHPGQGGITVGLGGLLFWGVPMLWFWVGRGIVDRPLADRVLAYAAGIAGAASCYGLYQALIEFPSWDWAYIFNRGRFNSLYVGPGTYRPFASFTSANEYALVSACGVVAFSLLLARGVTRRRQREMVIGAAGTIVTGAALALSSVRAPIVFLAIAFAVIAVVRLRRGAIPLLVVGLVLVAITGATFSQIDPDSLGSTGPQGLIRRAVIGLGHPFDSDRSTLSLHLESFERGLVEGFDDPLGDGTGTTNTAALRLGGPRAGTEWDLSDGAVAFGLIGLALVAFITVAAFARVGGRAWRNPDLLNLATLGFMIVTFRHWWNGGHYFLAPVMWILVGALDAPVRARSRVRFPT
jgi:hypothetical protein